MLTSFPSSSSAARSNVDQEPDAEAAALLGGSSKIYPKGDDEQEEIKDEATRNYELRRRNNIIFGLFLIALAMSMLIATQFKDLSPYFNGRLFQEMLGGGNGINGAGPNALSSIDMQFTMSREGYSELTYFSTDANDHFTYKILADYDGILEPYATNMLVILNEDESEATRTYYSYRICPTAMVAGEDSTCYDGLYSYGNTLVTSYGVAPACEAYDTYIINIMKYDATTGEASGTTSGNLICMYVRREIRDLSIGDLGKTMDAMFTMWQVTEDEGREIYGENYHSNTYLLEYHFFNAAWQDADHIHEGNGFIAQHIKMTNIFESAMQAVDPSVSLPYWDFTIESATNTSIMFSPIFNDQLFGSMPQPADAYWGWTYRSSTMRDAAVPNGRWAYVTADKNTKYSDLQYGYGYLRAPWNMNPSPYLSRFTSTNKHLPSCSAHYGLVAYDDITDFLFNIPYGAHAATHGTIGGVYGCDLMDDLLTAGYIIDDEAQINLCKNWIFYLKEFYRKNYIMPYTNCTTDDGNTDYDSLHCGFECNPDYSDHMLFDLTMILNSDYECVPDDMADEGWQAWKDFICTGDGYKVFGGDHLESASPSDPSFWPIHPTLERLLQAKYMAGGFFENDVWPTDALNDYVCDKPSCYDVEGGTDSFGNWEYCCYGHYEDDQLLDAPGGNRTLGVGWTNSAIHKATDPTGEYAMTYIYDDFQWDHCADIGLDIAALMEEKYEASMARRSKL